jgi:hypothetical protein
MPNATDDTGSRPKSAIKRLRGILRGIVELLGWESIHEEFPDQVNREKDARERERDNKIAASIDAIKNEYAANEQERKRSDTARECRERLTIFGLFATAAIAWFGYRQQHVDTLKAIAYGDAGWLAVFSENIRFSDPDATGNRLAFTKIWIRDRGKTPLLEINSEITVRAFSIQSIPEFKYEGMRNCNEIGVLYPDYSKSDEPDLALANNPPFQAFLGDDIKGSPLPVRTCREAAEVVPPKLVSTSEYQQLIAGQKLILVYGKITYVDIFKNRHWIHTCTVLSASNVAAPNIIDIETVEKTIAFRRACLSYNAIDSEDEQ